MKILTAITVAACLVSITAKAEMTTSDWYHQCGKQMTFALTPEELKELVKKKSWNDCTLYAEGVINGAIATYAEINGSFKDGEMTMESCAWHYLYKKNMSLLTQVVRKTVDVINASGPDSYYWEYNARHVLSHMYIKFEDTCRKKKSPA